MNQDLEDYVKEARTRGMSDDAIRTTLSAAGWNATDIDAALKAGNAVAPSPIQPITVISSVKSENFGTLAAGAFEPRPASHKKLILAICGIVLLLVAGTAFGYIYYFAKAPDPQVVLAQTWKDFYGANSWESSTTIQGRVSFGALGLSSSSFSLSVNNISESLNNLANYKESTTFDGFMGAKEAPQAEFAAETVVIVPERAWYVKLNTAQFGLFNLTPFTKQWVKIDLNTSSLTVFPAGYLGATNPLLSFSASSLNADFGFSSERVQKIRDLAIRAQILKFQNILPDGNIDGASMYHYGLLFDKDAFIGFLKDAAVGIGDVTSTEAIQSQIETTQKELQSATISPIEIWIGKKDLLPHKFSGTVSVVASSSSAASADINFTNSLKSFNSAADIRAPSGAKSLENMLRGAFGPLIEGQADLLAQARDSQRISDLGTLKSSISLYLADVSNPNLGCSPKTIYASSKITPPAGWKLGPNSGKTGVDGTGWLPINFKEISSGTPIKELPVDPVNDPGKDLVYVFTCDNATLTFEFAAVMESKKYGRGGASDVVSTDGGNDPNVFEFGTNLHLLPAGVLVPPPFSLPGDTGSGSEQMLIIARDARRISDLRQIQIGLELYFNHCGLYPGGVSQMQGCSRQAFHNDDFAAMEKDLIAAGDAKALPHDPTALKQDYHYQPSTGAQGYTLWATLEDTKSPALSGQKGGPNGICGKNGVYCVSL